MLDLFGGAGFMPHGYCLLWRPALVALHAVSDLLIFLSYFAIPFAILRVLRTKPELRFGQIGVLFAAFILLCGLTHLIGLVTLWLPIYEAQGVLKALTAIVSVSTVAVLFPLLPDLARMPDPGALEAANSKLRAEIERHEVTLCELETMRERLEDTIEERTRLMNEARRREQDAAENAMDHARSTLGIVQSLTRQTAAFAASGEDFGRTLSGRVAALGAFLAAFDGHGADAVSLKALVQSQIRHHDQADSGRITISGDDLQIATSAAPNIGLVVHELICFAAGEGAASGPGVRVSWRRAESQTGPMFVLNWEHGSAADRERVPEGFAAALLTRTAPIQMRGSARMEVTGSGFSYTLTVPMTQIAPLDRERRSRRRLVTDHPLFGAG